MNLEAVNILISNQTLLVDEYINKIKNIISEKNLYYCSHNLDDSNMIDIIEDANSLPMFYKGKLILAKKLDFKNKNNIKHLEQYINEPSDFTKIIFISDSYKKNSTIESNENVNIIKLDSSINIEQRVNSECEKVGLKIDRTTINTLVEYVGDDYNLLKNEIQKISTFYKNKKILEKDDIINYVNKINLSDTFSLINSISNKETTNCLKILKELEKKQEDPISILSLITWRFRQIFKLLELKNKRLSNEDIAKKLKISKGALYYLEKNSKKYKTSELKTIFKLLKNTDYKLKSSSINKYIALNSLLLDICKT